MAMILRDEGVWEDYLEGNIVQMFFWRMEQKKYRGNWILDENSQQFTYSRVQFSNVYSNWKGIQIDLIFNFILLISILSMFMY